jgi:TP53 regulating kinase-like protein
MTSKDVSQVDVWDEEWTLAFQGAESKIYFGKYKGIEAVKKERFVKKYRLPSLDEQLSRQRHRAEVRSIERMTKRSPQLKEVLPKVLWDDSKRVIIMTRLMDTETSASVIASRVSNGEEIDSILEKIGSIVGLIHSCGLVHGDLTTCNLLMDKNDNMIPIDFGLSSGSHSAEDRAVDLYVLERALLTTSVPENKFNITLEAYKKVVPEQDAVLKRLEEVRARGRKREMIG